MVMMSPVSATRKPAPAETLMLRTVMVKCSGAPSLSLSSVKDYWVFAMQTGILSKPSSVRDLICFSAMAVKLTPSA